MNILVDIGGTYARFAVEKNGKPVLIKKYAAADYKNFETALAAYASSMEADKKNSLLISTAAHPHGKLWRFVNNNTWVIDPVALTKKGFHTKLILNDFEAATWGLMGLKKSNITVLKKPHLKNSHLKNPSASRCLIGPGTGLGLAYLTKHANGIHSVQPTMGGHIAAAAVTAEQDLIVQAVRRIKPRKGVVVYEDLISGQGLMNIYHALCDLDGKPRMAKTPADVLGPVGKTQGRTALRLFHEFFGLFAASVVVSGHAYGGLYLTGGVTDRLVEEQLFNAAHFEKFFVGDYVPSVHRALGETGIYHVNDPALALRGLWAAYNA